MKFSLRFSNRFYPKRMGSIIYSEEQIRIQKRLEDRVMHLKGFIFTVKLRENTSKTKIDFN